MESFKRYLLKRIVLLIVWTLVLLTALNFVMLKKAQELHLRNLKSVATLTERNFRIFLDLYPSPMLIEYNLQRLSEEIPGLTAVYLSFKGQKYYYPKGRLGKFVEKVCTERGNGVFPDGEEIVICLPMKEEYASEFVPQTNEEVGTFGLAFSRSSQEEFIATWFASSLIIVTFTLAVGAAILFLSWVDIMFNFRGLMGAISLAKEYADKGKLSKLIKNSESLKEIERYEKALFIREFKETVKLFIELLKRIVELNKQVLKLAITDPLTRLYNRSYLKLFVEDKLLKLWQRERFPISVAMIDLDNFKKINDTYGHSVGDQVLKALADLLRQELRSSDVPIRYGGEEILVVFPYTKKEEAYRALSRIKEKFTQLDFPVESPVTFSAGIASTPCDLQSAIPFEELIKLADERLYEAKRSGKNKIVID